MTPYRGAFRTWFNIYNGASFAKIPNGVKLLTIFLIKKTTSQMFELVENSLHGKRFKYSAHFSSPTYKLSRNNMCDIVCDKVKGRGRTVKRASVYAEAAIRKVFSKRCYEKFHRTHKKTSVSESLFHVFL